MTPVGVAVTLVWDDEDVLLLEISASNGLFAGTVQAYAALDAPSDWSAVLAGFPANREDEREIVTGAFSPGHAGGGAALRFAVRDAAGHSSVSVRLRAGDHAFAPASAEFIINVEAAAIDRFVGELRAMSMSTAIGQCATLDGLAAES
jgi:hypothetical protein